MKNNRSQIILSAFVLYAFSLMAMGAAFLPTFSLDVKLFSLCMASLSLGVASNRAALEDPSKSFKWILMKRHTKILLTSSLLMFIFGWIIKISIILN